LRRDMKITLIAGGLGIVGGVVAAVIGLIPFFFANDTIEVEPDTPGPSLILTIGDLPQPSSAVAQTLNALTDEDTLRVASLSLIGHDNIGLSQHCLNDGEDESEFAAYRRLADLGLGSAALHETPSPPRTFLQVASPQADGSCVHVLDAQRIDQICAEARMCERSFSFVPSELGVATRSYLRALLASQIGGRP